MSGQCGLSATVQPKAALQREPILVQRWDEACPQCLTRLAPEANCNERGRAMKLNGGAVDEPCTTLVRTAIRSPPAMRRDCLAGPTALHLLHHRLTPELSRAAKRCRLE